MNGTRWTTGAAPAAAEMSSTLGALFLMGPTLILLWLALPHPEVTSYGALVAVCGIFLAVGAWLLAGRRRGRPVGALHLCLAVATVLVSAATVAAGTQRTGFLLFYVFFTPYSWAFFSGRAAAAHTAFAAVCGLGALVVQTHAFTDYTPARMVGAWVVLVGSLLSVGWLVRSLTASVRRMAAVHQRRAAIDQALAGFGERALEHSDLQAHLEDAVRTVAGVFDSPMAAVTRRRPDGRQTLAASVGMRPAVRARTEWHARQDGIAEYVARVATAVVVDDFTQESRFTLPDSLRLEGPGSAVAVPIQRDREVAGVVYACSHQRGAFDRDYVTALTAFATMLSQIVHRSAIDEEMVRRALVDPLTGLANRTLFNDRLQQAVRGGRAAPGEVAVIFMDIDRFKNVNDTFGHAVGDQLLRVVAPRLQEILPRGDTLARFGGDEFVVLVEGVTSEEEVIARARRLGEALTFPMTLPSGLSTPVSISMGISLSHGRSHCAGALLAEADAAMYRAKTAGGGQVRLFDQHLEALSRRRHEMDWELRVALETGAVTVAYQPIIDLATGAVRAVEALARWHHPRRGAVSPGEFISVAEETGLIGEIDELVLRTAVADVAYWQAALDEDLRVSVNVSAQQLSRPDFLEQTLAIYGASGLRPGTLCLEVTETALLRDTETAAATLQALHDAGVVIALDDFGTGFSSLTHLSALPIDVVKIDMAFVQSLLNKPADAVIVESVLLLAQRLGIGVIAEGVETAAIRDRLHQLRCRFGQGYYWSAGLPADAMLSYLRGEPGESGGPPIDFEAETA